MGLGYVALYPHALQGIDVCGLCLLSDPCGMDGRLEIVLTESYVDDLSTESEVERAVELGVGYFPEMSMGSPFGNKSDHIQRVPGSPSLKVAVFCFRSKTL